MTSATESESFEASIVLCGAAGVMTMHGKARGEGTAEAVPNLEARDSRLEQTHAISLYSRTSHSAWRRAVQILDALRGSCTEGEV